MKKHKKIVYEIRPGLIRINGEGIEITLDEIEGHISKEEKVHIILENGTIYSILLSEFDYKFEDGNQKIILSWRKSPFIIFPYKDRMYSIRVIIQAVREVEVVEVKAKNFRRKK